MSPQQQQTLQKSSCWIDVLLPVHDYNRYSCLQSLHCTRNQISCGVTDACCHARLAC